MNNDEEKLEELADWFDKVAEEAENSFKPNKELIINEEIKNRLFKLKDDEYKFLEENIQKEGCRDPLVVWNNILVDGHNRYEICKKYHIPFKKVNMEFENLNAVLKWVDLNQYGRRNLTPDQMSELRGKYYNLIKQEHGGNRGNQYTKVAKGQNVPLPNSAEFAAKQFEVNERTIKRDGLFAEAIEELKRNVKKELPNIPKQDIIEIAKHNPFEQEKIINSFIEGEVKSYKEVKKKLQMENRKNTVVSTPKNSNLHLGDCVDILKTLETHTVDCVVMDPPYAINYKDTRESFNPEFEDDPEVIIPMLKECFKELKRVCKPNAHIYCFFAMWSFTTYYELLYEQFKDNVDRIPLIWNKNNHTLCDFDSRYAMKYEPIFFISNRKRKLNSKISQNVLNFNIPTNKLHKTQKPLDLCEYFISNSTIEGEVVLDPFMGSGTTIVAAKNLKRKYIGIEKDSNIFNIAKERIYHGDN